MSKKSVSAENVEKANIVFALKNQAFNALMFVFRSFVSVFRTYESEQRAKELMDLFKPLFDSISKEFLPDFTSLKHE